MTRSRPDGWTTKSLQLADGLTFPLDAVTQTFGLLAVRGAGKSSAAAVLAEQMFKAHLPFVVVDPVGAWYGLRSSANGREAGLAIPIFGGRHGDVPLERTGGTLLADLVVDDRLSCVLDTSELSEGDKVRFLIDFGERLYRRNTEPLHLILEEADDYLPQRPLREQARCLGAWERIVRRGRARGLGITLITQRSAALNKNVLTQIETLIVLRTTSPQDRKAVEGWIEYHGQKAEVLTSLATLEDGEAWVWSPHWLQIMRRVRFHRRTTWDSGATPTVKGRRAATLANVNLDDIRTKMAATIERAKAEDPRELRAEIERLRRALKDVPVVPPPPPPPPPPRPRAAVLLKAIGHLRTVADRLDKSVQQAKERGVELTALADRLAASAEVARQAIATTTDEPIRVAARFSDHGPGVTVRFRSTAQPVRVAVRARAQEVTAPQQAILNAISYFKNSIGIDAPTRPQVAFFAQVSHTSSGYANNLSALRVGGWIESATQGTVQLTPRGAALVTETRPPNVEAMRQTIYARLSTPQAAILKTVIEKYPAAVTREGVADAVRVSPTSSGFANNLSALRTLGLIDYPQRGSVCAAEFLFSLSA